MNCTIGGDLSAYRECVIFHREGEARVFAIMPGSGSAAASGGGGGATLFVRPIDRTTRPSLAPSARCRGEIPSVPFPARTNSRTSQNSVWAKFAPSPESLPAERRPYYVE